MNLYSASAIYSNHISIRISILDYFCLFMYLLRLKITRFIVQSMSIPCQKCITFEEKKKHTKHKHSLETTKKSSNNNEV